MVRFSSSALAWKSCTSVSRTEFTKGSGGKWPWSVSIGAAVMAQKNLNYKLIQLIRVKSSPKEEFI